MDPRTRFHQIYSNLPLSLRNEIILVVDDGPITWNVANIEIENDTEKGKKILESLIGLGIVK